MRSNCALLTIHQISNSTDNLAKVSSQQSQQLHSEASKIPSGSGPPCDSAEDMSSSKDGDKDALRAKQKLLRRPEGNNGGSLEDCLSNVYSLLELPGIKWKCFRTKPSAPRGVPLTSDIILKAYSKCISDGILCTWRRKPLTVTGNHDPLLLPVFKNDTPKELWVFWYDDEPSSLQQHCTGLDVDDEMSSSNEMNMISYEVRTILFKALHVVLERDLTKDGYVRFGRWFTIPLDAREHYLHHMYPTYSPAIRLNFFLQGPHTVCTSVQAQRQPTLLTLAKRHLEHKHPKTVIVGPWSMRGVLVYDQLPLLADPNMQERAEREWHHWREFLQMEEKEPEKVPDNEGKNSPEPETLTPTPAPHRSLLTDSSDEEQTPSAETMEEPAKEDIPARLRWMFEPESRTEKPKEETSEEKEKRERQREVRRKRRQDREDRRKAIEKKRAEGTNPEDYDSEVVTDADDENAEERVDNEVPKMVLVEIDGVRMLYPSKFICVTLEDDRQVLEAAGFRTNTIPDELQVQGRRPRNRFVVGVDNIFLAAQAASQETMFDIRMFRDRKVIDVSVNGSATPSPLILRKKAMWKFVGHNLKCIWRASCSLCRSQKKRAKIIGTYGLPAIESRNMYKDMVNRVRRKHDFEAFHKKKRLRVKPIGDKKRKRIKRKKRKMRIWRKFGKRFGLRKVRKFIPSKKRQRNREQKEQKIQKRMEQKDLKFMKKKMEKDEMRPTDVLRGDSEDESYQMDKLCQQDWANFGDDVPTPVENEEVEKESDNLNTVKLSKPPHDENFRPEPFLPITFINRKNCVDFEYKPGDEDMSEERFNEVYTDRHNKWRPGMSRAEKIEVADYEFDPANQQKGEIRPYHLTEMPRKTKYEIRLPMPKNNKYYHGKICKNGLRDYENQWAKVDKKMAKRKKIYLRKLRRSYMKHQIKVAKWCAAKLETKLQGRCLIKAVNNLKNIAAKDCRSGGTKQFLLSKISRQKKYADKKKAMLKLPASKRPPKVEDVLQKLDVNAFSSRFEKAGPQGEGRAVGYIVPDYASSPNSNLEEESEHETDEQRNGLGEGTSLQYPEGESIDADMENAENFEAIMEISETVGHVRSVGEHIGPDGLLSPPASNEMPKGGPLSVGPPSIDSQGLNQIYPTPPSVQMLQAETAQAHSPLLHGKSRHLGVMEDEIERIAVPGGGATIVEIKADDEETENMKRWNEKTTKSKMSKFLADSCNDPVLAARKRKYDTPMTEKFNIEKKTNKVSAGLVYQKMLDRNFECAPPRYFGEMVRSKLHEKRTNALAASAKTAMQHSLPNPMAPMFQTPAVPPHAPSLAHGPMGHPMAHHGFPNTPGPFPPTTPTYPGMMSRPGFGPGPGYPNPQMMGPGYNGHMGQMGPPRTPYMNQMMTPQQHQQMQMMRMQHAQMMQNRQMAGQGMPPGYGAPGMPPYPPGAPGPVGYGMQHQGASSVQQLNMFVNQTRFGANAPHPGHPPPYGAGPMIPQSPNFNQAYGGMGSAMMSPLQQHQYHQQQMHQQMQMQQHQQQIQRSQMQQQQMHFAQQQQMVPTAHQLRMQQQKQWEMAINQLPPKKKKKFFLRQRQLVLGRKPTSLQPLVLRKMVNQPDANIPINRQPMPPYRPPELHIREGDSLTIAIILSDTILDLHFDSVFDACPICSCSVSIRSRDLGMYITPHEILRERSPHQIGPSHSNLREHTYGAWSGFHVNSATNCTCGFSAIRHRYLSCCTGLFAEDANEATTLDNAVAAVIPPLNYPKRSTSRNMVWFDSKSVHDLALIDTIRNMAFSNSLGKAISQVATIKEHRRDLYRAMEVTMDVTVPSEYIISHVDRTELMMLGNSAITMAMKTPGTRHREAPAQEFLSYFHPWGLQTANEIPELEGAEWVDLFGTVTSTIESAMKQARNSSAEKPLTIDGPLTWQQFVSKSKCITGRPVQENEEDFSLAEPIPAVMRATSKEAIRCAPHIDSFYDQAGLGPVDQPKNVMYITVIPDDDVIFRKTVKFMETVTEMYEKMKLGRHIPFPVSAKSATRFRKIYKANLANYPHPEQHNQLAGYVHHTLQKTPSEPAGKDEPWHGNSAWWSYLADKKSKEQEVMNKGQPADCEPDYKGTFEDLCDPAKTFKKLQSYKDGTTDIKWPGFYDREGIIRVGTPCEPIRLPPNQTVTSTAEFSNMTKHIPDNKGFVTKLRIYLQQMEDLVTMTLLENDAAFERRGYRYQMAVEERLKIRKKAKTKFEEKMRFNAAKKRDDLLTNAKPDEEDVKELREMFPGVDIKDGPVGDYVDREEAERARKKRLEDEQYPYEGPQAPSPLPAGMIHIPETLSEQERPTQPSLADIFSDPNAVTPQNASSIKWKPMDTSVPNPFPSSNQPPVPFESIGTAETDPISVMPHVIVVYMVNPFTFGGEGMNALHMRIALLSFIRVFNAIMGRLPYQRRPQLQLEIIGMEGLDGISQPMPDYLNDPKIPFDILHGREIRKEKMGETTDVSIARALSVAVFTHPRVLLPEHLLEYSSVRCMTAFGPGSQLLSTLHELERMNSESFQQASQRSKTALHVIEAANAGFRHPGMLTAHLVEKKPFVAYRVPSSIVTLAPPPIVCQMEENQKPHVHPTEEQTLFVAYCLVGTDFLVATATDAQGKLMDNCIANIKPRRQKNEMYRYKNRTQVQDGMGKLWSFILGLMSSDTKNWRLVVGRLGRIGHGEFRAWTHLLNKTTLLRYSNSLKDICSACRSMPTMVGTPAILSACLITLEPEPNIRIIPEYYDHDAAGKKSTMFQTPGDLSCTHILTFPVGAEINLDVQDTTVDSKAEENWEFDDFNDLDIMGGLDDGDTEIMKDLGLETPSSAAIRQSGGSSMFFSEDASSIEIQNQPLASGYYISTAPAPELPTWFWATCPSAKRHCPVHLKSSLHINISEVKNDDIAMESTKEKDKDKEKEEKGTHPLESRQTEEVLRHVLESYNALSWLNMNRQNGDRHSCLPIHIQHLLRLYHSVARLLI